MFDILYFLVVISVALSGAFVYRISKGLRTYRGSEHGRTGATSYGLLSEEAKSAEWDIAILRWTALSWTLTGVWGTFIGLLYLIS